MFGDKEGAYSLCVRYIYFENPINKFQMKKSLTLHH
jgi:hypothetical protein